MEKDIGEVMPPWPRSVELAIQHVGQPGEGMPVVGVHRAESPLHSWPGEPCPDHGIFNDVREVIEGDEVVVFNLDICQQGCPGQQQAEEQLQATRGAPDSAPGEMEAQRGDCFLLPVFCFRHDQDCFLFFVSAKGSLTLILPFTEKR